MTKKQLEIKVKELEQDNEKMQTENLDLTAKNLMWSKDLRKAKLKEQELLALTHYFRERVFNLTEYIDTQLAK